MSLRFAQFKFELLPLPAQVRREERISLSSSAHLRHSTDQLICHFPLPPATEEREKKKTLSRSRRLLRHDAVYLLFSTPTPHPTDSVRCLVVSCSFPPHPTHTEKSTTPRAGALLKEYVPRTERWSFKDRITLVSVDDAGCHWEMEHEVFLHPISRLFQSPCVIGPA
ncbi:hypothetical protein TNCV_4188331 [Trichonephila clavipes]|nr:hypothetical protein TNCV_4188331 [Trichonephila clavipes]